MCKIKYEKDGHVAYIILNSPETLNALTLEMAQDLKKIWVDYRDDDNLWVAILSGEGKSFCSGANVKSMERGKWKFRQSILFGEERIGHTNYGLYKPIIAAVQRHAYGAGLLLALESDVIIASDDALFAIPEGKVNVPTLLAPFLGEFMPRAIANELMYTGIPIDAKRAYDLGIINKVVPKEHLMAETRKMAELICETGPLANWASKEILWRTRNLSSEDTLTIVEHIATPVWNAEDSVEGKKAFKEKRKPEWKVK